MSDKKNEKKRTSFFGRLAKPEEEKPVLDEMSVVEDTMEKLIPNKTEEVSVSKLPEMTDSVDDETKVSAVFSDLSDADDLAKTSFLPDNKNYDQELNSYKKHQEDYQNDKISYDKILDEYETLYKSLDEEVRNFSDLNNQVESAHNLYQENLSDYHETKNDYEKDVKGYEFATSEKAKLDEELGKVKEELSRLHKQLEEISDAAKQSAQLYEDKTNENLENEADLKSKTTRLNVFNDDMELLSGRIEKLQARFEEEQPKYDELKDHYLFVNQIKNDYEILSLQFEKMQLQEDNAKQNLDEIQELLEENTNQLEVSTQVSNFTADPLINLEENYEGRKEKFLKIEHKYLELKARFDTESANFARIAKNYADLTNSDNANRVALHYVTEEYNSARAGLDKITEEIRPIEKSYLQEKAAFDIIDADYSKMSELVKSAKNNLTESQRRFDDSQRTYSKVEESYEYIRTQNGILKQNLSTKEAQYNEISNELEKVNTDYKNQADIFEPLDESLQASLKEQEELKEKLAKSAEEVESAQKAFDQSTEQVSDMMSLLAEVKLSMEALQTDRAEKAAIEKDFQAKADELKKMADESLTSGRERYALASSRYQNLISQFDAFSELHSGYSHSYQRIDKDYQKVSSLYRLAKDEYDSIERSYQAFISHGERVSSLYHEVMKAYEADKDYYDKVYAEYQKVQEQLKLVLADKDNYDLAILHVKTLLIQGNALTFPIYEATGHNYVDNFNLPTLMRTASDTLSLKEKPQFDSWMSTYTKVRGELVAAVNQFGASLNGYQEIYNHYVEVGGERLKTIDANQAAYTGIDLASYVEKLDNQVANWREEYEKREEAFAILLQSYTAYLEREKQLLNLVSVNSNIQEGIQSVIGLINSVPDYTDMYSTGYGDVSLLARYLGMNPSELTKPRSATELAQIFRDNYYRKSLDMIKTSVASFVKNLNLLKADYKEALKNLHKELSHFSITTEISISGIQLNGIINDGFDFEQYLESNVERNYENLRNAITEVSSIANVIRRAGGMSKVANRTIDTTVDNTMLLPDKSISMSESLMRTDIEIYIPKNMPIPIEPDEPTAAVTSPQAPMVLEDEPSYIYQIEMPVNLSVNINDLVKD
ncbi:MAG: hypothetical protein LBI13_00405 [Streptococcaceae bacterium]|jgi:DNA repair exonuclease SbcCD ATPase subunit|nr:hypothetical protein [Streptococcaceae bacterium]